MYGGINIKAGLYIYVLFCFQGRKSSLTFRKMTHNMLHANLCVFL
jgi:hypothetical protein